MGPKNHNPNRNPRWGHDRTNLFGASSGDKSTMRPFVKLLWTLVFHCYVANKCLCVMFFPHNNNATANSRAVRKTYVPQVRPKCTVGGGAIAPSHVTSCRAR